MLLSAQVSGIVVKLPVNRLTGCATILSLRVKYQVSSFVFFLRWLINRYAKVPLFNIFLLNVLEKENISVLFAKLQRPFNGRTDSLESTVLSNRNSYFSKGAEKDCSRQKHDFYITPSRTKYICDFFLLTSWSVIINIYRRNEIRFSTPMVIIIALDRDRFRNGVGYVPVSRTKKRERIRCRTNAIN